MTGASPDVALRFTLRAEEVGAIEIPGNSMNPRQCAARSVSDFWRANAMY